LALFHCALGALCVKLPYFCHGVRQLTRGSEVKTLLIAAYLGQLGLRFLDALDDLGRFVWVEAGAGHLLQLLLGASNVLLKLLSLPCCVHKTRSLEALVDRTYVRTD
jgi:hypothetical protein